MHTRYLLAAFFLGCGFQVIAQDAAPNNSPEIVQFEINRYQVEGNTLLPNESLGEMLAPFTGSNRDFGDVQRAVEALENEYHRQGYTAVQVYLPEQELVNGVVRLMVIEARIGKVIIDGNKYFNMENIRASLPGLHDGQTPNLTELSASLRLANENPAKKTTLEMQATDQDNQVDARIKVQDESPWRWSLNVDNTGTPQSGRVHYGISLQHANLANSDQVATIQYTTSSDGPGVSIYGFGYHIPLYRLGDSFDLFSGYSDVASGELNGTPITGRGTIAGIRYNQDLGRKGNYTQRLIYGLDYRNYQGIPLSEGVEAVHPITAFPLSLTYSGSWVLSEITANFSLGVFRNIPGGQHGSKNDFAQAISLSHGTDRDAADDYSGIRYNINFNYALPAQWLFRATLNGQYTNTALISGEQIGLAGTNAVRGFPERDIATDRGNFSNLEIYTPDLCGGLFESNCRILTFFDHAAGSRLGSTNTSIGSIGLGLKFMLGRIFDLEINGAQVIDEGGTQQKDDRYLHFQMGVNF